MLADRLGVGWFERLEGFMNSPAQMERGKRLGEIRKSVMVYPSIEDTFRAFRLTPYESVKTVILGQDPYHDGVANGLAFSTTGKINPSLQKIIEGMEDDLAIGEFLDPVKRHNWEYLATQGVLLLNVALTVERGRPNSHTQLWEPFTLHVMDILAHHTNPLVFLLWGANAQSFATRSPISAHKCIMCEHPAFAARQQRAWIHQNCFSKANSHLETMGVTKILW
jgi:uracil-DNA glycosylase